MNRVLQDLIDLLDLEPLEVNMFRGQSRDFGGKSVYGGQVIGQALVAAARTVDESIPHSLHAYFLRPGDMAMPIVYEVDRVRVKRSPVARLVQAIQHGQPILSVIDAFRNRRKALPIRWRCRRCRRPSSWNSRTCSSSGPGIVKVSGRAGRMAW